VKLVKPTPPLLSKSNSSSLNQGPGQSMQQQQPEKHLDLSLLNHQRRDGLGDPDDGPDNGPVEIRSWSSHTTTTP